MGFQIVIAPYKDPSEGLDWNEQKILVKKQINEHLSTYPGGKVRFSMSESDQGIGADFPTIVLEILAIGSTLFFGIPALHKKIRKNVEEWVKIKENIEKFIDWISNSEPVVSYSIEFAFVKALSHLQGRTKIDHLILLECREIIGKCDSLKKEFARTPLVYYLFIFRESDELLHVLLMDCKLRFHIDKLLPLDPRIQITDLKHDD